MNEEKPEGQSYTPEEVAVKMHVHISTVHELLRSEELKGYKLNRQWRITPEELQRFMTRKVTE